MAQFDFGTIDPATKSGTALAGDLNSERDALLSSHGGASRPSYAVAGTKWLRQVSATAWEELLFDGTDDLLQGTYNPTLNTYTPASRTGGIPASAISAGSGSGLDADMVDGVHATALVQTGVSSGFAIGVSIKFPYTTQLNTDDGKIGSRLFGRGLNIVGVASESGDFTRYTTGYGDWSQLGNFVATGQVLAQGVLSTSAGRAVISTPGNPMLQLFRTGVGGYAIGHILSPSNFYEIYQVDAAGAGVQVWYSMNLGGIWHGTYGWLHEYFARRTPASGLGATDVRGNCGGVSLSSGYELFDVGGGVLQVRAYVLNCANCGPTNCNCACDCAGGGG